MAVTVKRVALWRTEVSNQPGELARVLEPLAEAKTNLRVVMGYGLPGATAVIELFPVTGKKAIQAAEAAGLKPSPIPWVLVEGDDRPGIGRDMTRAIADAGVNVAFVMGETVGRRFSAVFGFSNDADAATAEKAMKAGASRKRK